MITRKHVIRSGFSAAVSLPLTEGLVVSLRARRGVARIPPPSPLTDYLSVNAARVRRHRLPGDQETVRYLARYPGRDNG